VLRLFLNGLIPSIKGNDMWDSFFAEGLDYLESHGSDHDKAMARKWRRLAKRNPDLFPRYDASVKAKLGKRGIRSKDDLPQFRGADLENISPFLYFAREEKNREVYLGSMGHVLATGQTDAGKTVLTKRILHSLSECREKVLWTALNLMGLHYQRLDTRYRNTVAFKGIPENLLCLPDGIPSELRVEYESFVFDCFGFYGSLMLGARSEMSRMFSQLSREFDHMGQIPNLNDLELFTDYVLRQGHLNQTQRGYCQRFLPRLQRINQEGQGCFNCQKGVLDDVRNCNQIYDLSAFSEDCKRFLVPYYIGRECIVRKYDAALRKIPRYVVIDEAACIVPRRDEAYTGEQLTAPMFKLIRESRNFNVYLIVAVQELSRCAHPLLANTPIKIIFKMVENQDLFVLRETLGLNAEELDEVRRFKQGECLVRLAVGEGYPFRAKVDMLDENALPRDGSIRKANEKLKQEILKKIIPPGNAIDELLKGKKIERFEEIQEQEWVLLKFVSKYPGVTKAEIQRALNLGNKEVDKLRFRLEKKGLLSSKMVETGKRGGQPLVFDVTEKARSCLKNQGEYESHVLRGDGEHAYCVRRIGLWLKRQSGGHIEIEKRRANTNVDLVHTTPDNKKYGYEVCLSSGAGEVETVVRDLQCQDLEKIVVVSPVKRVLEDLQGKLKNTVNAQEFSRLEFKRVKEFIE
jgi:DNA-binding MarR family transcriptional regulator